MLYSSFQIAARKKAYIINDGYVFFAKIFGSNYYKDFLNFVLHNRHKYNIICSYHIEIGIAVLKKGKNDMAKNTNSAKSSFDPEIKKGLIIALVIVLLFSSGNFLGGLFAAEKTVNDSSVSTSTPTSAPTTAPTTAPATAPASTAPAASDPASNPASEPASSAPASEPASQPSGGAPTTPAEIIKLYNESANKIKTGASKVTRNYEDLQHNEEYLQMPSALQSIGSGLISSFLKKDETPVDYTGAEITANYPVKGESFVSNTTEADIAEATCTDDGTNYNVTLKFKECTDPSGSGCANAFNIIKPEEVYNAAKVVTSFSVRYYDATIECKIDKATGNMTWAKFTLPMVMSVTAKVIVPLDAQVGMTFIDDYTITY